MIKHQQKVLLILKLALGILFLWSGTDKALSGFSASSYLLHSTFGPFTNFFKILADNKIVDFLVVFGEIGIGLSLITHIFVKFAAYAGILMMMLFYLSTFPPEHGLINQQIIYALIFWSLTAKK